MIICTCENAKLLYISGTPLTKNKDPEITTHIDNTSIFSSAICGNEAANGEARVAVLLAIFHIIAPCHGHVVNDPVKND